MSQRLRPRRAMSPYKAAAVAPDMLPEVRSHGGSPEAITWSPRGRGASLGPASLGRTAVPLRFSLVFSGKQPQKPKQADGKQKPCFRKGTGKKSF